MDPQRIARLAARSVRYTHSASIVSACESMKGCDTYLFFAVHRALAELPSLIPVARATDGDSGAWVMQWSERLTDAVASILATTPHGTAVVARICADLHLAGVVFEESEGDGGTEMLFPARYVTLAEHPVAGGALPPQQEIEERLLDEARGGLGAWLVDTSAVTFVPRVSPPGDGDGETLLVDMTAFVHWQIYHAMRRSSERFKSLVQTLVDAVTMDETGEGPFASLVAAHGGAPHLARMLFAVPKPVSTCPVAMKLSVTTVLMLMQVTLGLLTDECRWAVMESLTSEDGAMPPLLFSVEPSVTTRVVIGAVADYWRDHSGDIEARETLFDDRVSVSPESVLPWCPMWST